MPYRPDIDGLRALAVIGVILFHADLGLSGGFVGVDVFFVISGFLITSLIIKDIKSNQFSLSGFWERRARRIFPALYVVTITTIGLSYLFLLPKDFEILGGSVIGLSFFSSNIFFGKIRIAIFRARQKKCPCYILGRFLWRNNFILLFQLFFCYYLNGVSLTNFFG